MCQVQKAVRRYCRKLELSFVQTEAVADHAMHVLRTDGASEAVKQAKARADRYSQRFHRQTPHKYRPGAQASA